MELLTNYSITYCGKCSDGYVRTKLHTGEEVLTACECKIKNDNKFIYNNFVKNSNLQYTSYGEHSFENPEKFVESLMVDEYKPQVYQTIYNNFFKHTSTKLVSVPQFVKFLYGEDLLHTDLNFVIINNVGANQGTHFFSQFMLNVMLKRLVPSKIVSFQECHAFYMDIKKYDLDKFVHGMKNIILTQMFSDDMVDAIKSDFKYERMNKFLFELYNYPDINVYVFTDKYVSSIRQISIDPKVSSDKALSGRINSIFDLMLNRSKTVITQIK